MIQITRTLAIDERALDETFVRASGPGGQNGNRISPSSDTVYVKAKGYGEYVGFADPDPILNRG